MSRSLSKNTRVLLLIALMAASSFGVGGAVYVMTSADTAALKMAAAELDDLHGMAFALQAAGDTQEAALNDYVLSANRSALQRYNDAVAVEDGIVSQIGEGTEGSQVRSALELAADVSAGWRLAVAVPAISAVQRNDAARIAAYGAQAAGDQGPTKMAINNLTRALDVAGNDLLQKEKAAGSTIMIGVVLAFGFMLLAFAVALVAVRRFGNALELDARQASILNRFTEVTSFATNDSDVAASNLTALQRLARPDASVTHVLNRSLDRAVPEAKTGNAIAEVLALNALGKCAGVLRRTMYVTDDLSDDLSVHCPVYPAAQGTLACVPLISGQSVGAVHLYWSRPNALPLTSRASIARITEHAALAIGNQRLLAALHGQANTDARTGLANSRSFDTAVEEALAALAPEDRLSLLMIDVDNFKDFNDRHGHPAGDEALRVFSGVLRSCMREGDVAGRYGGEEFAVLLRGAGHDVTVAHAIAERIRARTETTIISLAPGITDRITVSVGVATSPNDGADRVSLLRIADEALYRAKGAGRNRVAGMSHPPDERPKTLAVAASA